MTAARRLPQTRPTPRLTGGTEGEVGACAENPRPFDTLIEVRVGERFHAAVTAAREVCGRCHLQQTCLVENRHEDWARAVITGLSRQQAAVRRWNAGRKAS